MNAKKIIEDLDLTPHPEGGWYKETFQSNIISHKRSIVSMIYYLLQEGEVSHWHRVNDADEIWLWHLGDPLILSYSDNKAINKEISSINKLIDIVEKFFISEKTDFPNQWGVFKKLFNKNNISRKECLMLPFSALSKIIKKQT